MQKSYPQATPASEQPSRLVYLWSEVRATAAEPTLKGEPNAVEKKYKDKEGNEVSTEDPATPQGRNVIRGQAIMMARAMRRHQVVRVRCSSRVMRSESATSPST